MTQPRIGMVRVKIEAGKESMETELEVASLSSNVELIIGRDLCWKLGIQLSNVPLLFPNQMEKINSTKKEKIKTGIDLPPGVGKDGIAEEWKKILEDNLKLPVSSVCRLEDSELAINTGDSKPSWIRQYPIPQALMERVRKRIQEWIHNGWVIEAPKNCKWNTPLVAANKPAKEKGEKDDIRLCLDARFLNEKIQEMPDSNLPLLRDVIDQLGGFNWITLIDLADSYHQFKLRDEDQPKTAFTIDGKQWMFRVVPFGLKVMTGHMQRIMEGLLGDLGVAPFQDDTAIASKTTEEHIKAVKEVLERITYKAGLRIKSKKCKFFQTEARVLGIIVSRTGLKMDPKKIESIVNWPRPIDGLGIQ